MQGKLVFILFINDVFDSAQNNVDAFLYADNGALSVTNPDLEQVLISVQDALDTACEWTQ